ncbi:MAG: BamA/TamA family outer membrane protein, partial [Bacteroidota bacterium]
KINAKNTLIIEVEESWYLYPIPYWYTKNNSIETLTYGVYFLRRNFRGRNETLKANIAIGYDKYFSLQYDNPALFYDNEIGFSALVSYYNYTNVNETAKKLNEGDFIYKVVRGTVGFWKRINQFYLVGTKAAFDYWEINTSAKGALTASGNKRDRLPSLSFYQFYDTRDLKLFSQNGIYSFLSFAHKGFGVDGISYNSLEIDLRGYQIIAGELSSKLRLFHSRTFGRQVPFYDYSFLGFSEKIRGHNNIFYDAHNSLLTSLELSYPLLNEWNFSIKLPLIPKNLTSARVGIHFNLFADAGTVFNNGEPLILKKFHSGYGVGLTLLLLPYNAIRFEYAINELGKGEIIFAAGFSF